MLVRVKGGNASSIILWRAPAVEKIFMVGKMHLLLQEWNRWPGSVRTRENEKRGDLG